MQNSRHPIIFLGAIAALLLGCSSTSADRPAEVAAHKAFVVFTEESWGCITGQRILSEAAGNELSATVDEIKNSEDRNNRNELLLYYPAKNISNLPGYFILRVGIMHKDPGKRGHLLINQARLIHEGRKISFLLRGSADGEITADLYYSRHMEMQSYLSACPESNIFEPFSANLFTMQPVLTGLKMQPSLKENRWTLFRFELLSQQLAPASGIDFSEELLDRLDRDLRVADQQSFLWDMKLISEQNLKRILTAHDNKLKQFNVSVQINDMGSLRKITVGNDSIVPDLRQNIIVKAGSNKTIPGKISISVKQ